MGIEAVAMQTMQPQQPRARSGRPLVCFMTASVVAVIALAAGRGFSASGMQQPSVSAPGVPRAPNIAGAVHKAELSSGLLKTADGVTNSLTTADAAEVSLQGSTFAGLQPGMREVNVAM